MQCELEKKQQDFERILQDQQKSHADHQSKVRQLENELEEQRRENVCQPSPLSRKAPIVALERT